MDSFGFTSHKPLQSAREYQIYDGKIDDFRIVQAECRKAIFCGIFNFSRELFLDADKIFNNCRKSKGFSIFSDPGKTKEKNKEKSDLIVATSKAAFFKKSAELSSVFDFQKASTGNQIIRQRGELLLADYFFDKKISTKYLSFFSKKLSHEISIGIAIYPFATYKSVFSEPFGANRISRPPASQIVVFSSKSPPKITNETLVGGLVLPFTQCFDFGNYLEVFKIETKEDFLLLVERLFQSYLLIKQHVESTVIECINDCENNSSQQQSVL